MILYYIKFQKEENFISYLIYKPMLWLELLIYREKLDL